MKDRGGKDRKDTQADLEDRDAAEHSLGDAYEAAWDEWAKGDGKLWESTVGDGLRSGDRPLETIDDAEAGA